MSVHSRIYSYLNGQGRERFLADSAYAAEEIESTLERAETIEKDYQDICSKACSFLVGMNGLKGFDTDEHETLSNLLLEGSSEFTLQTCKGVHEMFPVKTWQALLGKQERHIKRLQKAITKVEAINKTHKEISQ